MGWKKRKRKERIKIVLTILLIINIQTRTTKMKEITSRFNSDFFAAYNYCDSNNLYLGLGNPEAKILLIGKETSDEKIGFEEMSRINLQSWNDIILKNRTSEDIKSFEDNALFPWKGQKFTIRREKKDGTITGDSGTSTTWYYYQYFTDLIFKKAVKKKQDLIDFHEFCFHTEMNQLNAKQSNSIPKSDVVRINSIKDREKLFAMNFFRNFEIIVLANGHYHRDFNFNIEKAFDVKWTRKTIEISKGNWYNLHYDNLQNPKRILIHTRQFSTGISKELIQAIANEIVNFQH